MNSSLFDSWGYDKVMLHAAVGSCRDCKEIKLEYGKIFKSLVVCRYKIAQDHLL